LPPRVRETKEDKTMSYDQLAVFKARKGELLPPRSFYEGIPVVDATVNLALGLLLIVFHIQFIVWVLTRATQWFPNVPSFGVS